jgi:uncharacterized protein Yka (UPF0111/DUF47 family)
MFSLQRFLSNGDKFFDLLEASAGEAHQSVHALIGLINAPRDQQTLDEFVLRRREDKRITQEMTSLLCSAFITPLEREDIEALSHALYRIPKTIEKFVERLLVTQSQIGTETFVGQAKLLEQATDSVYGMVRQLRHGPDLDEIRESNSRLHGYEGEADKLILDLLRDLYSGRYDALQMIVLRDLYELLEKVIDRCRDAGNVIFQIALKNS